MIRWEHKAVGEIGVDQKSTSVAKSCQISILEVHPAPLSWWCNEQSHTEEAMDTDVSKTLTQQGTTDWCTGLVGTKCAWEVPKEKMWLACWKKSLYADFRAMHRQVINRTSYHTVYEINTINAVCRWGTETQRGDVIHWKRRALELEVKCSRLISLVWWTVTVLVYPWLYVIWL